MTGKISQDVMLGDIVNCRIRGVTMTAIVVKVWSRDCVNLIAFSDLSDWKIVNQYVIPETSVMHHSITQSDNDCWWGRLELVDDKEAE